MSVNLCSLCGERHIGECHPDSFNYYKCKNCDLTHRMPWDSIAFCGMQGLYCGCEESASEQWESIDYDEFKQLRSKESE